MCLVTEQEAGVVDAVWVRVADILHPLGHHEHVGPAHVRRLALQLPNKACEQWHLRISP